MHVMYSGLHPSREVMVTKFFRYKVESTYCGENTVGSTRESSKASGVEDAIRVIFIAS